MSRLSKKSTNGRSTGFENRPSISLSDVTHDPLASLFSEAQLAGIRPLVADGPQALDGDATEITDRESGKRSKSKRKSRNRKRKRRLHRPPRQVIETLELDDELLNGEIIYEDIPMEDLSEESSEEYSEDSTDSDLAATLEAAKASSTTSSLVAELARWTRRKAEEEPSSDEHRELDSAESEELSESSTAAPPASKPSRGKRSGSSLVDALMQRPRKRRRSALESVEEALEAFELQRTKRSKKPCLSALALAPEQDDSSSSGPIMKNALCITVKDLISVRLPMIGDFHVANAMDVFDRPLLQIIWKAHRNKFLSDGKLEYAVSASSVIDALGQVEERNLVAAYVETMASDYLVWVELNEQRLLASFANARHYFA